MQAGSRPPQEAAELPQPVSTPIAPADARLPQPQSTLSGLSDQYDIGAPEAEQSEPEPRTDERSAATQDDEPQDTLRPRNPDGTFAKRPDPADSHPRTLVRRARDLGFADDDIRETPTAILMELVKDAAEDRRLQARAQEPRFAGDERPQAQAHGQAPPPADDLGIDERDYDPGLVGALKKVHRLASDQAKVIEELRKELGQIKGAEQARQAESLTTQADRFFAKHQNVYGAGTAREVKRGSPEHKRRLLLLSAVEGESGDSFEERAAAAHAAIYGAAPAAPAAEASKPTTAEEQAWLQAGLHRPTHRAGGRDVPGTAKAIQSVEQLLRDRGADRQSAATTEEFL